MKENMGGFYTAINIQMLRRHWMNRRTLWD